MSNLQSVLAFDGKDDNVVLSKPLDQVKDAVTIEFWANATITAATSIMEADNAQNTRVLNIHLPWSNRNIYWDAGNEGGYDRISKGAKQAEYQNTWNHWAFTKDKSTGEMHIYRNGEVWQSGTGKHRSLAGAVKVVIGSFGSGAYYWGGLLAEFRIWSVALSASQIKENMHYRLTGNEPGLVGYWPLNEGSGNTVQDQSPSNNDGTINGATWEEAELPITTKEETLGTGLQDYSYWRRWLQNLPETNDGKPFRRGRIWA